MVVLRGSVGFCGSDATDVVLCILHQLNLKGDRVLVLDETVGGDLINSVPAQMLSNCLFMAARDVFEDALFDVDVLVVYSGYFPGEYYNKCSIHIAVTDAKRQSVTKFSYMMSKLQCEYELLYKDISEGVYNWMYLDLLLMRKLSRTTEKYVLYRNDTDYAATLMLAYEGVLDKSMLSDAFYAYVSRIIRRITDVEQEEETVV